MWKVDVYGRHELKGNATSELFFLSVTLKHNFVVIVKFVVTCSFLIN